MSDGIRAGHDLAATLPQQAVKDSWFSLSRLSNQFPALHGLRVLAVVSVVQIHVSAALLKNGTVLAPTAAIISHQVWYGMDCFFILSGFLIGSMLARDPSGIKPRRLGRFYLRRSFRIFPLYYLVLTGTLLVVTVTSEQWGRVPFEYMYLTNYMMLDQEPVVMGYAWSLAVEEHFYLAAPFIVAFVGLARRPRWRYGILFLLWLIAPLARWLTIPYLGSDPFDMLKSIYVWTHTRADILVAGIFLAFVQRDYGDQIAALFRRVAVRVPAALIILACVAFIHFGPFLGMSPRLLITLTFGTVTSVMYIVMVLWLVNYRGPIARFFSMPAFLDVATLGYGIYLLHIPVIYGFTVPMSKWMTAQGIAPGLVWIASLIVTMVLAWAGAYVLHLAVDKPMLRARQRFVS